MEGSNIKKSSKPPPGQKKHPLGVLEIAYLKIGCVW
jgi:hypothetical protein